MNSIRYAVQLLKSTSILPSFKYLQSKENDTLSLLLEYSMLSLIAAAASTQGSKETRLSHAICHLIVRILFENFASTEED